LWLFILGKRLIETRAHDLVVRSVVAGVMANSYLAKVLEQCKCAGLILITDDVDDTNELMQLRALIRQYNLPVTLWTIDKETERLRHFAE
jgi:hypothetical protein